MQAHDNRALRVACEHGNDEIVMCLLGLGLTADDARSRDNEALRHACKSCSHRVVMSILDLGLTADDARANNNQALRNACTRIRQRVVERLLDLGLTADDVRAENYEALRNACNLSHLTSTGQRVKGSAVMARALAARLGEGCELPPDLHAVTLEMISRETTYKYADTASRRHATHLEAVRAAAWWPGHEEVLAKLGAEAVAAWEALYAEAVIGALRFAD